MKNKVQTKTEDIDDSKIVDLYAKLEIDTANTLEIRELGKEYRDMIDAMENECYATTAYVNR